MKKFKMPGMMSRSDSNFSTQISDESPASPSESDFTESLSAQMYTKTSFDLEWQMNNSSSRGRGL